MVTLQRVLVFHTMLLMSVGHEKDALLHKTVIAAQDPFALLSAIAEPMLPMVQAKLQKPAALQNDVWLTWVVSNWLLHSWHRINV